MVDDHESSVCDSAVDSDHSTSFNGSTTNSGTTKKADEKSETSSSSFAKKETLLVKRSKMVVIFCLALAAIAVGVAVFLVTTQAETTQFAIQTRDYALEIGELIQHEALTEFMTVAAFARTVTSYAMDTQRGEWPFVRVPHFEVRGTELNQLTKAILLGFSPIVMAKDRELWEVFAGYNQAWVQEGVEFSTSDGSVVAMVDPIPEQLYYVDENNQTAVYPYDASSPPQFLPVWQLAPAPQDSSMVNYDLLANDQLARLFESVAESHMPILSKSSDLSWLYQNSVRDVASHPHSILMQPVFDALLRPTDPKEDANVTGIVHSVISWDPYFQNLLPVDETGKTSDMVVVLQGTCGDAFTYVIHGPEAEFLGYGDLHEPAYEDMVQVVPFDPIADLHNVSKGIHHCEYTMHIYPSHEMEQAFRTSGPILYSILVVLVFAATTMVFVCYDYFVQRRQDKVMATAKRSKAIVTSLFPANVRDRILQDAEEQVAAQEIAKKKGLPFTVAKNELKSFLDDGEAKDKALAGTAFDSKPIADLFPSTTVMFGDIVGFTAWSSVREPAQVFQLLETLYQAFDEIAKRRRVFKVETIGDCYVAVCGLPEPRKDHATVMARFARDVMTALNDLTKQLEIALGPDTGDLSMRIGLHSGPVTAGVLRGDNCRFQLFGDTVNTAARMESNGARNKIHLSDVTANLLKESGKAHWLIQRPDKIMAKGKGEMTTYWLELKQGTRSQHSAGTASSDEDAVHFNLGDQFGNQNLDDVAGTRELSPKLKRLVHWNAESLIRLLKEIVARREAAAQIEAQELGKAKKTSFAESVNVPAQEPAPTLSNDNRSPIEEVVEIISLPKYNAKAAATQVDPKKVELTSDVVKQVYDFVTVIATMYRNVPFHNFEHCSHVTMSVYKLLSRIVAPDHLEGSSDDDMLKQLHDHTYGITSDPMTQFAVVLAAIIHDVDHTGVPNTTLIAEKATIATVYQNQSVAEQNSIDIAWDLLMDDGFSELRSVIYANDEEKTRFRQLFVNVVMATDICDKDLKTLRNERWAKAFNGEKKDENTVTQEEIDEDVNRKATIVLEHLIQASDIAHTMQHWHIYRKWNEKFFEENMVAYKQGRAEKNPAEYWYKGEIGFFDFYIIPLSKKLKECGVFGVSCDEYLSYAENNRKEWEANGEAVVAEMMAKFTPALNEADEDDVTSVKTSNSRSSRTSTSSSNWADLLEEECIFNVAESWQDLCRIQDYEVKAGTILFQHLFESTPAAKLLFGFPLDLDPKSPLMTKSKRFLQHAAYMVSMLDRALSLLGPDTETLGNILYDLGRKHVQIGVKPQFFPDFGVALYKTLEQMLGKEKFDAEMEQSWKEVYGAISGQMIKAMQQDRSVYRSWMMLKKTKQYPDTAGLVLFQKFFQLCPESMQLFGLPKSLDVNSKDIAENKRFLSHAGYFIEMLSTALDMVNNNDMEENMERLGQMHNSFGVKKEYFPLMGDALMHMLKQMLKKKWTHALADAWADVYNRLSNSMIDAMERELEGSITTLNADDGSITTATSAGSNSAGSSNKLTSLTPKMKRLVHWNAESICRLLKEIMVRREAVAELEGSTAPSGALGKLSVGKIPKEDVVDAITMPKFNREAAVIEADSKKAQLPAIVVEQVYDLVTIFATRYRDVPFSNFEHCSHVTMTVHKLISRIAAPLEGADHTFGVASDPMTKLAVVIAALVHDLGHTGQSNAQVVKEKKQLATKYQNESVAEQNSLDVAWGIFMADEFKGLRAAMFADDDDQKRFRQLLVNCVMSTDISTKDLKKARITRWDQAFKGKDCNAKATVMLETLLQAADNIHNMQHTHVYQKWNEMEFAEQMRAFKTGHADKNPAEYWYEDGLSFFDSYIIPLAKKLQSCGVLGADFDEYLAYAQVNRSEWKANGEVLVAEMATKYENMEVQGEEDDDNTSVRTSNTAASKLSKTSNTSHGSSTAWADALEEDSIFNVADSWEDLRRLPNYQERAGTILFQHLFTDIASAKLVFGYPIDMDPSSKLMTESKRFKQHAAYFVQMLDRALSLLGPDTETLGEVLYDLGRKHVRIGVKADYFPAMQDALIKTLREMLGSEFDAEIEESWKEVYGAISGRMIYAMDHEKSVVRSWMMLKKCKNYQERAGVTLFVKFFELAPEAKVLFGLPRDLDVNSPALLESRRFKSHAEYFITMLDLALDMVDNNQVEENMERLGQMHVSFGVKAEYFPFMGEALMHMLKQMLRKKWTHAVQEAWVDVYHRLSSSMINAMQKEIDRENAPVADDSSITTASSTGSSKKLTALTPKTKRLVHWNAESICRQLKEIMVYREAVEQLEGSASSGALGKLSTGKTPVEEVVDAITMPKHNAEARALQADAKKAQLPASTVQQVYEFVTIIASHYKDNLPFSNFEHCSHVTLNVHKFLSRIIAPASGEKDATYGITSDPMTQLAVVLAALIHDLGAQGVPNTQLVKEGAKVAKKYENSSVSQQYAVDTAWDVLMADEFEELRAMIYSTKEEQKRFRQLLVNCVMATDICTEELKEAQSKRWDSAFKSRDANQRATVLLEHLMLCSVHSSAMQHWHVYSKFSEMEFAEHMKAFKKGRAESNPADYWYKNQLNAFDRFLVPLAKKINKSMVLGAAFEEHYQYVLSNREQWKASGEALVSELAEKYDIDEADEEAEGDDKSIRSANTSKASGTSSHGSSAWADGLEEESIFNVAESWEELRRMPDYEAIAGTILFKHLFTAEPHAKLVFGYPIDMDPSSKGMTESKRFKQHAAYFIQMLDRALSLLGPDTDTLGQILYDLGRKHVHLGVKEAFFEPMCNALILMLGEMLGEEKFNADLKESWKEVYGAISNRMIIAMNNERNVTRSWHKLKRIKNYQERCGVILFQRFFLLCPESKTLFGFSESTDVNSPVLLESRRFKTHAAYFVEMLDRALQMVEAKTVGENMQRLGEMHASYGVKPTMFPLMGEALFHALKTLLKKDWTHGVQEAWADVFARLSEQMIHAIEMELMDDDGSISSNEDMHD